MTPEPKSPSVLASAHASPRVDRAHSSTKEVGQRSKIFRLQDLSFSPTKVHPTFLFLFIFITMNQSSSNLQGCVDPGLLAPVPRV